MPVRILLAEDESDGVELLTRFLQPYSAFVESTDTISGTIRKFNESNFDCLILDLRLKDSDREHTLASIRDLKQIQPDCGIIVCSGLLVPNLKEDAIAAGADTFIHKNEAYLKSAKALLLACEVAIMHHPNATRSETIQHHLQMIRSLAESA